MKLANSLSTPQCFKAFCSFYDLRCWLLSETPQAIISSTPRLKFPFAYLPRVVNNKWESIIQYNTPCITFQAVLSQSIGERNKLWFLYNIISIELHSPRLTDAQPDGQSHPGEVVEVEHEGDVDDHAQHRQKRNQRNLGS